MSDSLVVRVEGLDSLECIHGASRTIRLSASKAINRTARDGRVRIARGIRERVNFPASFLSPTSKRLWVSKKACHKDLTATISAQVRPTSLAQFIRGKPRHGKQGQPIILEVKPGGARYMRRAFLIRLRQGVDSRGNVGLAIRPGKSEQLRNKTHPLGGRKPLAVLYGPSVSQVFDSVSGKGVAVKEAPKMAGQLEQEFLRLLEI